jgi:hypothetical protein
MSGEVNMLERLVRLVETFGAVDDFCKTFLPQWEAYLIGNGTALRGPKPALAVSEIIMIVLVLHDSRFKYLKSFYNGVTGEVLRRYFPAMSCISSLPSPPVSSIPSNPQPPAFRSSRCRHKNRLSGL